MPGTCSSYAGLRYFRDVAKRCGPLMAAVGDQLPCQTAQLTIVRTGLRRELTAGRHLAIGSTLRTCYWPRPSPKPVGGGGGQVVARST